MIWKEECNKEPYLVEALIMNNHLAGAGPRKCGGGGRVEIGNGPAKCTMMRKRHVRISRAQNRVDGGDRILVGVGNAAAKIAPAGSVLGNRAFWCRDERRESVWSGRRVGTGVKKKLLGIGLVVVVVGVVVVEVRGRRRVAG